MDIVELFIDETDEVSGIEAISVVENPAIEENFIALKNQEFKLAEVDKEKRILMGAALIPNKPIYRQNGEQEYYIYFSQATVRKASELFFINGNQSNSTLEHQLELKGLTAVESWIVESEQDKSRMYDLNVPMGTWMVSMKVNNDDVWKKVKNQEIKGFSIEGYFADKLERPNEPVKQSKMSKEEIAEAKIEELKQLLSTEKVELGSFQEIKQKADKLRKTLKDADIAWRNYSDYLTGADKTYNKMISTRTDLVGAVQFAEGAYKRFEKGAKELGVDPMSSKDFKLMKEDIKETNNIISVIDGFDDPSTFQS